MTHTLRAPRSQLRRIPRERRGAFAILALLCLTIVIAFAALSVDYSHLAMSKQRMQNACDAAALAAAMEITAAIESAGPDVTNVSAHAQQQARLKAAEVAGMNGVYVDPTRDVEFGRRFYNTASGEFDISWNQTPANLVRVTARRDNPDRTQPDAMIPVAFAGVIGRGANPIVTEAAAYVEARDIVCVLDFSRSMNFDSHFSSEKGTDTLSQAQIASNLALVWQDLGSPAYGSMPWEPTWVTIPSATWGGPTLSVRWEDTSVFVQCANNLTRVRLTFDNGATQTFSPTTGQQARSWAGTGSNANRPITKCECRRGSTTWETFDFYNNSHISRGLGLTSVTYPWPSGSWSNFFTMCRNKSGSYYEPKLVDFGYNRKFGIMTFMHYVLRYEPAYSRTPDLWQTRHYPFHSVKEGQKLLCDFLEELSFNDYVGLVSYDSFHRIEQTMSGSGMPTVDISSKPVTNDYQSIRDLINYKQCGHYAYSTNIGGGLKSAKSLLDTHGRAEARPTILLMTDGNSNTIDSGESTSLPGSWNWDYLFDYDGDGSADYSTSDSQKRYVLKKAKECVDAGYTIHTMVVGDDGDRDLMEAVAHLGRGIFIDVPSGSSVSQMEEDVREAFNRIASFVPPATLLSTDDIVDE